MARGREVASLAPTRVRASSPRVRDPFSWRRVERHVRPRHLSTGATTPVVAGVVERTSAGLSFAYAESYLARAEAIPLYSPELPLRQGIIDPGPGLRVAGSLRDAAPDARGQRITLARRAESGLAIDPDDVLTFMLDSGSDRIGALDFQPDPREYRGRGDPADLDELISAGSRFAEGEVFSEALASRLAVAKRAAGDVFNLSDDDAAATIDEQVTIIREQWAEAADEALLTAADRQLLWERLILNPASLFREHGRDMDYER